MPILHLVAGPNGAGKTLLYEFLIRPRYPALPFLDPQAYAAQCLKQVADPRASAELARQWAAAQCEAFLRGGQSFVLETAFSHASRVALITQARELGFEVVLYALGIDEPRKLLPRIAHGLPPQVVLDRYPRILDNYRRAIRLADLCFLFDVADVAHGGPRLVASIVGGQMRLHTLLRPRWVQKVLGFAEA